ncbi:MAG: helix-turn-helix transcriptional regulator [Proteobacteria bacterium]|nr:helix-turn-helix transcriptional regulator [Pseudomonadota bacterium]
MEIISARDLSKYLKINEKKIYKLVQESKLPHIKIGGKIAFTKETIDKWILESTAREENIFIAGSDDILLRRIIDVYNSKNSSTIYYAPVGSINGLKALKKGAATMSCVHILDIEKKEYNTSYIERYLSGDDYIVIQMFFREQGLYLQKNNSKVINSIEDIAAKGATFINRNQGSGTRLLFDFLLREKKIDPSDIKGYNNEVESHLQAGLNVVKGNADVAFGVIHLAHMLGLNFVPLFRERFDMVIPKEHSLSSYVKNFLTFFEQPVLHTHIKDFTGYDASRMGNIIYPNV